MGASRIVSKGAPTPAFAITMSIFWSLCSGERSDERSVIVSVVEALSRL